MLDNSGDLIISTVLTTLGRERMAKGTFSIKKFCLFDDEINYGNYNRTHASGSAYYDVELLQTLVMEPFTDDSTTVNSKLISISRDDLLYLPVLKLNELYESSTKRHTDGVFIVAVDEDTEDSVGIVSNATVAGIMYGFRLQGGSYIRVDQGMDTTAISPASVLDPDLYETQYMVRVDNRFGKIVSKETGKAANISFIDEDNIATYFLNMGTDPEFVRPNTDKTTSNKQTISGPRGSYLQFQIKAGLDLVTSDYLFNEIGSSKSMSAGSSTVTVDYIDSIVRVEGATTGFRLDIPVRFVKQ